MGYRFRLCLCLSMWMTLASCSTTPGVRITASLESAVNQSIDNGEISGAVVLVARNGQVVHHQAYGLADLATGRAMRNDDLFRIASMTKPMTSSVALMLVDEGLLKLDAPVSDYVPVLGTMNKVIGDDGVSRGAAGAVTIRHLLTHTSGLSYRFMGVQPQTDSYTAAGISDGLGGDQIDTRQLVARLATQPLVHDPGAAWTYGLNTDVLGRVIEIVTGQSLADVFQQRLFKPLGMHDTYFEVERQKHARIVPVHRRGERLQRLPDAVVDDGHNRFAPDYPYDGVDGFLSGGAGVTSTAADYARFLQMFLNGGEGLLSETSLQGLMSNQVDHLDDVAFGADGFSLAFAIDDPDNDGKADVLRWGGYFNTSFWLYPERQEIVVVLAQTYPFGIKLASEVQGVVNARR